MSDERRRRIKRRALKAVGGTVHDTAKRVGFRNDERTPAQKVARVVWMRQRIKPERQKNAVSCKRIDQSQ